MEEEGVSWLGSSKGGKRVSWWRGAVRRRLPILRWAGRYEREAALADLVAGVTLGLTLVPQSIAYAALANLPVQYGLYSSFVGTMLYVVLGTVKEVSIGPTSLMALFTLQICRGLPVEFVVLLTFLSGCVVLIMGLLRLGFLVELISPSVTSGFTSATAVIIVAAQLKGLLGLSFTAESVLDNIRLIALKHRDVRTPDLVLGLVCCTVLLLLRWVGSVSVGSARTRRALWLISISRNALVVLAASTYAYCTHDPAAPMFKLSGRVEPGLPQVSAPLFSTRLDNSTVTFVDMVATLGSAVLLLPLVMVLANIAIAKAFSDGGRVDATQEMVTLGLCNMAGAFVHAMPTCGAFTRSAVSHSSGVRTPAAGLYSGIITLLALIYLTQYFYFIPKACLSAVLICAVIFMGSSRFELGLRTRESQAMNVMTPFMPGALTMLAVPFLDYTGIDFRIVGRLWRSDRVELVVVVLTFSVSVYKTVELALLAGALASLAVLLRKLMRPTITNDILKTGSGEAVVVCVSQGISYVNAELVMRHIARAARAHPKANTVLIDAQHVDMIDYAAMQALERLIKKLLGAGQQVLMFNVRAGVLRVVQRAGCVQQAGGTLRADSAEAALHAAAQRPTHDNQPLLALST